jgi:dGTPase
VLEQRYPDFDGLNLSFETREGILKHCSLTHAREIEAREPGGVGRRFIDKTSPGLEAQLANLADEIAYNAHDIDDGVRSSLLSLEQLEEQPLIGQYLLAARQAHPQLEAKSVRRLLFEAVRRMLSAQVYDVVLCTQNALQAKEIACADDARRCEPLVRFSSEVHHQSRQLKKFLFDNLYRHPQVMQTTNNARQVVSELFAAYVSQFQQMSQEYQVRYQQEGDLHRVVSDYIAGMTDRFAIREHQRLTGQRLFVAE